MSHVQCGQKGASSRDFQWTVSIFVIFTGGAVPAAEGPATVHDGSAWRLLFHVREPRASVSK
ncbi:MAG: hypothetical protein IPP47_00495 [Bryobacterales bacterium]|nr:hypothetical protein [Bryobacterales bacterium]